MTQKIWFWHEGYVFATWDPYYSTKKHFWLAKDTCLNLCGSFSLSQWHIASLIWIRPTKVFPHSTKSFWKLWDLVISLQSLISRWDSALSFLTFESNLSTLMNWDNNAPQHVTRMGWDSSCWKRGGCLSLSNSFRANLPQSLWYLLCSMVYLIWCLPTLYMQVLQNFTKTRMWVSEQSE